MSTKPTPDISVKIVELPVPILKHTSWMEITYPNDLPEDELVASLKEYLGIAEALAASTEIKQLKIPTDPTWTKLSEIGFQKTVEHMSTEPDTLTEIKGPEYTIRDIEDPAEVKDLITQHFQFHAEYKPEYFTTEVDKRVRNFIEHAKKVTKNGDGFMIAAIGKDNKPIGFLYGECENGYGCVDEIFVEEANRDRGCGTAMIKNGAEKFKAHNCKVVGVFVGHDALAYEFYQKRGFSPDFANWIKNLAK